MKKLLVFASVAIIGTAAFAAPASTVPRVYDYKASLKTTVARNAAKVTWKDCDTDESDYDLNVCYRVRGNVTVKGLFLFDCYCVTDFEDVESTTNGMDVALMATSPDKFKTVAVSGMYVWNVNRLGSPLDPKAKIAEMGFDTWFRIGGSTGVCGRAYWLWHAGFGKAAVLDKETEEMDIVSISGNVVGEVDAPLCGAAAIDCPYCQTPSADCPVAIAFAPCVVDCEDQTNDKDGTGTEYDVAHGTFTLKFNSSLSKMLVPIDGTAADKVEQAVALLVPKVFNKDAIIVE